MKRTLAIGLALACSCSDPECRPGERKIGMTCYPIRSSQPDAGEFDVDGIAERADGGLAPSDAAAPRAPALDAALEIPDVATVAPDAALQQQDANAAQVGDSARDSGAGTPDACVPAAEVCDDTDNDCDGMIDEKRGDLVP